MIAEVDGVRARLFEIRDSLQGTHDACCVPVWANYNKHEPNSNCELIETCNEALALLDKAGAR